jgi:hypothetical protein
MNSTPSASACAAAVRVARRAWISGFFDLASSASKRFSSASQALAVAPPSRAI